MATDNAEKKADKLSRLRAKVDAIERKNSARKRNDSFPAADLRRTIRKQRGSTQGDTTAHTGATAEAILYRRDLPRHSSPSARAPACGRMVVLEDATDGVEIRPAEGGRFYVVSRRVDELDGVNALSRTFCQKLADGASSLCSRLSPVYDTAELMPGDIIFLDVESTGLGSSPLFLIGVMLWEDGGFQVRQYFARNYAEEAAVITAFIEACAPKKLLVTFNGKSFDFPFIRARAAANAIPFSLEPAHFDLLHECRRIWKDELPDCKLQTLERHICRKARFGDIPGCEIPDAYHAFVRTGNAWQMVEALKHNMLDLVTLADLMTRFPGEGEE